ncbi:MAG: hypothetical protein K1X89_04645 [Myxococcaceae bacterium]|nr:hypothetical protein [Myxococcaceae bacterium]
MELSREHVSRPLELSGRENLTLAAFGSRFSDPDVERDYRRWLDRFVAVLVKRGVVAATFIWVATLALVAVAVPERAMGATVLIGGMELIILLTVGVLGRRPDYDRLAVPLAMGLNTLTGLGTVVLAFRVIDAPVVSTAGLMVVLAFAFTVFRLRPSLGLVAVVPYVVAHTVLMASYGPYPDVSGQIISAVAVPLVAVSTAMLGFFQDRFARETFVLERLNAQQSRDLERERLRSDLLLKSILPADVAEQLKTSSSQAIATTLDEVTVLFADLVGFTALAGRLKADVLVQLLDEVFREFDALAVAYGVEKIKTIGDAYMAVAGAPRPAKGHAAAAADLALAMQEAVARLTQRLGEPLALRIGLASGPAVAGVIGTRKFAYDLWGDTVNTASRMESHGAPGAIQLAASTRERLGPEFTVVERGEVDVKGKGVMRTFWLEGRAR